MRNFRARGDALTFTNTTGAAIASGQLVIINAAIGVAAGPIPAGQDGVMNVTGVFALPKAPSQAWAFGELVYWDEAAGHATTVDAGGTVIGIVHKPVAGGAGDTLGEVRLNGAFGIAGPGI